MQGIINNDCLIEMKKIKDNSIDLIYLDPPFFTQTEQKGVTKDNTTISFNDKWYNLEDYLNYIKERVIEIRRILKDTGSIFLHCDKIASHYLRVMLDEIFGMNNFQSDIVWTYRRWSNSKKGLLNSHQNIFFYSKTKDFKFNTFYTDYSPTTNVDQILQQRERNSDGKCVYKKDENDMVVIDTNKKGVPLSDVWDIPFLNPKAKERTGYPTQKPILLLEKIIEIATNENDIVLDPFCGSGTTLVAAKLLNRQYMGMDISKEAIKITKQRLDNPIKTESNLMKKGIDKYKIKTEEEIEILNAIGAIPVQRNQGIDGLLISDELKKPIAIKIQKDSEDFKLAKDRLVSASRTKDCACKILIKKNNGNSEQQYIFEEDNTDVIVVNNYNEILKNKRIFASV